MLAEFTLASEPGNERAALAQVADAVAGAGLTPDQIERLKTAVAEATMNAIEHGNHNRPELDVAIRVTGTGSGIAVSITDHGGAAPAPADIERPDLDKKLHGLQSPRGWGLFLIQNMVDAMTVSEGDGLHTLRLEMNTRPADGQPAPPSRDPGGLDAEQM